MTRGDKSQVQLGLSVIEANPPLLRMFSPSWHASFQFDGGKNTLLRVHGWLWQKLSTQQTETFDLICSRHRTQERGEKETDCKTRTPPPPPKKRPPPQQAHMTLHCTWARFQAWSNTLIRQMKWCKFDLPPLPMIVSEFRRKALITVQVCRNQNCSLVVNAKLVKFSSMRRTDFANLDLGALSQKLAKWRIWRNSTEDSAKRFRADGTKVSTEGRELLPQSELRVPATVSNLLCQQEILPTVCSQRFWRCWSLLPSQGGRHEMSRSSRRRSAHLLRLVSPPAQAAASTSNAIRTTTGTTSVF